MVLRNRLKCLVGASVIFCLCGTSPTSAQSDAPIIFTARVKQIGAVSFADVPQSDRTVTATVTAVGRKPDAIALAPGDEVTIEMLDPKSIELGRTYVFSATGWIFGAKLAVRELSHTPAAVGRRGLQLSADDTRLRSQVQSADSVVVGQVTEIRNAPVSAGPGSNMPISEHEPQWKEAVIKVSTTIKGTATPGQVVVRFPASNDVAYRDAPKFTVGQSGTFLLHNLSAVNAVDVGPSPTFEMIKRADQLSVAAAARVKNLSAGRQ